MRHPIDPKIDCVFKALLGAEANCRLLVHFLNAVLGAEMRQAMSTLKSFSEKERAYHAYQACQNFLRQQRSTQRRIAELSAAAEQARAAEERERAEKVQARAAEERERAQKEQAYAQSEAALQREAAALAEIERLKRLLTNSATQ